jgi:predicted RNA-binding protein YlqC (UPF0109 family)
MGLFDWIEEIGKDIIKILVHEKADVSVECEDSADNGVINIDNSYIIIYNY